MSLNRLKNILLFILFLVAAFMIIVYNRLINQNEALNQKAIELKKEKGRLDSVVNEVKLREVKYIETINKKEEIIDSLSIKLIVIDNRQKYRNEEYQKTIARIAESSTSERTSRISNNIKKLRSH